MAGQSHGLLGAGILGGAEGKAGGRGEHAGDLHVGLGDDLGDTEVDDLHVTAAGVGRGVGGDEDILRLDVAVDHAAAVGEGQGIADAGGDFESALGGQRTAIE